MFASDSIVGHQWPTGMVEISITKLFFTVWCAWKSFKHVWLAKQAYINAQLAEGASISHTTNVAYNASTLEIFCAILKGGTLVCLDNASVCSTRVPTHTHPSRLTMWLRSQKNKDSGSSLVAVKVFIVIASKIQVNKMHCYIDAEFLSEILLLNKDINMHQNNGFWYKTTELFWNKISYIAPHDEEAICILFHFHLLFSGYFLHSSWYKRVAFQYSTT